MADTLNMAAVRLELQARSLHGCSLLFDNPGLILFAEGDLLYIDSGNDRDSTPALYKILHDTIAPHESDHPINRYLLRPKPASFYHVTVWGGVNDQNVGGAVEPHRTMLRDWLARLPESLSEQGLLTSTVERSPLVRRANWNVRFRFDKIVNWHNACLAALLVPFDSAAEGALSEIARERAALSEEFEAIFGIKPPDDFVPHITLRAFADREAAQMAAPYIAALSESVYERAGEMTLTFDSISLYGFTSTTRVFKLIKE